MTNHKLKQKLNSLEAKVDTMLLESNPEIKLARLPLRPLAPGKSATIINKKTSRAEREKISDWLENHVMNTMDLFRFKRRLENGMTYKGPLTPEDREHLIKQIEELEKELDAKTHGYDKIIDYIIPIIRSKCSEYLPTLLSSGFLYRGIKKDEHKNRLAFRGHSRIDRGPKDSDMIAQDLVDDALTQLDIKAKRSNSIFCTGNKEQAENYGSIFLIFPCNGSSYSWSKQERDMIIRTHELLRFKRPNPEIQEINKKLEPLLKDSIDKSDGALFSFYQRIYNNIINDVSIKSQDVWNIVNTMENDEEISGKVNNEIAKYLQQILDILDDPDSIYNAKHFPIDADKFNDAFDMMDFNLDRAIRSKHEILFCGEYIAVTATLESLIKEALKSGTVNNVFEENPKPQTVSIPTRYLAPGNSSTIISKKTTPQERQQIDTWLRSHATSQIEIRNVKHRLDLGTDVGGIQMSPERKAYFLKRLNELEKNLNPATHGYDKIIDYIIPIIRSKCSEYLPILMRDGFLYRGIAKGEHKNRLAFRARSRDGRIPKDSEPRAQELFDDALERLGIHAQRNNSVFCTSDKIHAEDYGPPFLLFPCNGSSYSWSDTSRDLIIKMKELRRYRESNPEILNLINHIILPLAHKLLEKLDIENINLRHFYKNVIFDISTIDIDHAKISTLLHIEASDPSIKFKIDPELLEYLHKLYELLENEGDEPESLDVEKFNNYFDIKDTKLDEAIDRGHEILFCGEYIAVISGLESQIRTALEQPIKKLSEAKPIKKSIPFDINLKGIKPGTTLSINPNKLLKPKYDKLMAALKVIRDQLNYGNNTTSTEKKLSNKIEKNYDDLGINKIISYIQKNCGNYLTSMKEANKFLYRGIKTKESKGRQFFIGNSRDSREPRDSNIETQQKWDEALKLLHIKAARGNSIFTSGHAVHSSGYGPLYLIFPLDSAAFSWTNRSDLILRKYSLDPFYKIRITKTQRNELLAWKVKFKSLLPVVKNDTQQEWKSDAQHWRLKILIRNIDELLKYKNELRINEIKSEFYAIDSSEIKHSKMYDVFRGFILYFNDQNFEKLEFDLKGFQEYYKVRDDDFIRALRSDHEICISGHYIAIKASVYKQIFKEKFGMK